jgi:hypothetical protein
MSASTMINYALGQISLKELEREALMFRDQGVLSPSLCTPEMVAGLIAKIAELSAKLEWTPEVPTEVGTYALIEAYTSADHQVRTITKVTETAQGDLIYGGMRMVEHAPLGSIWHRISDFPAVPEPVVLTEVERKIAPKNGFHYQNHELCGIGENGEIQMYIAATNKVSTTKIMVGQFYFPEIADDTFDQLDRAACKLGLLKDQELVGLESSGYVIQWSSHDKASYVSGESIDDFGINGLSHVEIGRLVRDARRHGLVLPAELRKKSK